MFNPEYLILSLEAMHNQKASDSRVGFSPRATAHACRIHLKGDLTFLYKSWPELPNIVILEGFNLDIARKNVGNVHQTSCKVFVSHNTRCEIILSDFRIHLTIDFSKEIMLLTVFGLVTAHIELGPKYPRQQSTKVKNRESRVSELFKTPKIITKLLLSSEI